jgi:glycerol-3-phosphate acyltransferase PlsY
LITWIALTLIAFLCGSLPFSVWLGKILLGEDVRRYGDGNPGAANAFRTGNKLVGLLALLLDVSKAATPVGLAYFNLGIRGVPMFLIALAPILGHVFSPFLRFSGGKGLATALGVWIGLTIWKISLPAAVGVLIGIALFTPPGWSVMLALCGIILVLFIWLPDPLLLAVWLGETLLLAWTHRLDLKQGTHLRPWVARLFTRSKG